MPPGGAGNSNSRRTSESDLDRGIADALVTFQHDINNPLASLLLNVEMLKEGGQADAEAVEEIETAAKRIAAIVRRLEGLRVPRQISAIGGTAMDRSGDNAAATNPERAAPRACTILLVDDEASVRAIICKILNRSGHKVLEAEHGADAVRLAEGYDGQIDLLISDMYMPGLRGPEIVEKLALTRPGLKVLYMSGYGDDDVARSGVDPSFAFLRKPFTVRELSDAVESAISPTGNA